jgi:hypothetical protein
MTEPLQFVSISTLICQDMHKREWLALGLPSQPLHNESSQYTSNKKQLEVILNTYS